MTYRHDDEARREAASHPPAREKLARLRQLSQRKIKELGPLGVLAHPVGFSNSAWADSLGRLPGHVVNSGKISRGDVFDIAAEVRQHTRPATDLFTASFLWGTGMTGYGASRHHDIADTAGDRLEPALSSALAEAAEDPIAGYAALYGGDDRKTRARAFQAPWARIHRFGPAFFTKFLYFSTPGALILDNVLANTVHKISGMEHLVTPDGRSVTWTPYRYAVYLHWMNQTADQLAIGPDLLELTLFSPPRGSVDSEGEAA
ncbi:8-oxoguanine DNA glycosylase OGG fold protein [Micromonospora sp. NPDC004704]